MTLHEIARSGGVTALASAALVRLVIGYDHDSRCDAVLRAQWLHLAALLLALAPTVIAWRTALRCGSGCC